MWSSRVDDKRSSKIKLDFYRPQNLHPLKTCKYTVFIYKLMFYYQKTRHPIRYITVYEIKMKERHCGVI